jgi:hypothetical protein
MGLRVPAEVHPVLDAAVLQGTGGGRRVGARI